jgi:hypothetical protein
MMSEQARVMKLIRLLRTTDPRWFKATFTNGACYRLYEILHHIWPEAEAWIAEWPDGGFVRCHVYTRIGERYYDIEGWHALATLVRRADACGARFRKVQPSDEEALGLMVERRLFSRES